MIVAEPEIDLSAPVGQGEGSNLHAVFVPSAYQSAFFQEVISGTGNIQLVAVAGSGKTKSLEEGVKRIPRADWSNTLLCAFNNHIKKELLDRQQAGKIPPGIKIATLHGLGYSALLRQFKPANTKSWVSSRKTRRLVELAWAKSGVEATTPEERDQMDRAKEATLDLVRLAMLTLTTTPQELRRITLHYGLDLPAAWEEVALSLVPRVLLWTRNGLPEPDNDGSTYAPSECSSFDDMIYLPVALGLRMWEYKWICVDECQDLNECQLELLMRVSAPGARRIFVGDKNQAIYGFTGASAAMFDEIQERLSAKRLPLSVCYRCASSVVSMAKVIVPQIEAAPQASHGVVRSCDETELLGRAAAAWREDSQSEPFLLLSRCNAPLLSAAFALIRQGIPAWVKGRDIGMTLIRVLEEANRLSPVSLRSGVEKWKARHLADLDADDESAIQAVHDKAQCCHVLLDATPGGGLSALKSRIEEIFAEEGRGVILSSVHKSKGLEADRVGILRPESMPMPFARQAWQMDQEINLIYVAITRAKQELLVAGSFGGMLFGQNKGPLDFKVSEMIRRLNQHLTQPASLVPGLFG